ncbi:curli-like amyloid fiber formation chaperone CsgH [Bosea sp. BK604]|uniref:curli-like amyloid fiber formation chaperone CsgH n=1 Tax=Bosea sp. BK604 TaxID=2512180 RepID=UPI001045AF9A|nr:curli-like amyloid fiber formation chaperone CsgH [Bosea sp. BK604]
MSSAGAEPAGPSPGDAKLRCDIIGQDLGTGYRLKALARTAQADRGEYQFMVLKQSASGTSQNMQSGAFSIESSGEQILTAVVLERSAQGHVRAELAIETDHGSVTCNFP